MDRGGEEQRLLCLARLKHSRPCGSAQLPCKLLLFPHMQVGLTDPASEAGAVFLAWAQNGTDMESLAAAITPPPSDWLPNVTSPDIRQVCVRLQPQKHPHTLGFGMHVGVDRNVCSQGSRWA